MVVVVVKERNLFLRVSRKKKAMMSLTLFHKMREMITRWKSQGTKGKNDDLYSMVLP